MTQHLHSEFVPGCYRCDLSQDEIAEDDFLAPDGEEFLPLPDEDADEFDGESLIDFLLSGDDE